MKHFFRGVLGGVAAIAVVAVLMAANAPGARLARGYIFRGDSSNVATAFDANDSGKVLVGDGTDLTATALGTAMTSYSALTRGYVYRGSASGLAEALDANDAGKILVGDGTDVGSALIGATFNKYLAAPTVKKVILDFTNQESPEIFADVTHAIATAAANQVDRFYGTDVMDRRVFFEMIQALQNDDLFIDKQTAAPHGWMLPLDNTDGDSIEITQGIIDTGGTKFSFTIGTDAAFYVKGTFNVTTVADIDVLQIGFRKIAAYVDVTTGNGAGAGTIPGVYTDVASIGINHNGGQIRTLTDNDNAAPTETALAHAAWADGETHALEVYVSAAGAVTYKIDGAADANAVAYSFDATDIVIPFIVVCATGASESEVVWRAYEVGHQ